MVLENIVVYILDKYLGDYIENLDYKKLKIDLWNGNVVLEKLYLKPNALADLNLPVTVSTGYLEKLTLVIPWKNLYKQPTKAYIDGLYILVVPKTEVQYDAQQDENEQYEAKMKEVQKIEGLRKEKEAYENSKQSQQDHDTFVERMQLTIIRNLELSIRNIHIAYEDKTTKPGHPFSFGLTLNYIELRTTDTEWNPVILKEDTPVIFKLGELSSLAFYWNSNSQSHSDMSRNDVVEYLRSKIATKDNIPNDITYILRPLNVIAKLIMVTKPREDHFKRPMFDIMIDLDQISFNINREQYSDLLDLLEFQDYVALQTKFVKYRSMHKIQSKNTKEWWKFAYNVIVNEEVRPRFDCYKWENIKAHLDRCREYRTLHFQELTGKLTYEQKQRAQEIEKKLDVFNLTYIRRSAEIEAIKKKEQEPKTWWGNVSTWWAGNTDKNDPELDLEKVLSSDEKKKLYDAIGYEGENTSSADYPNEYVDINLAIGLKLLDVNIWSRLSPDDLNFNIVARAVVPGTNVNFKRRPASAGIKVAVGLRSFELFGLSTTGETNMQNLNENRPVLAKPQLIEQEKDLLNVEFETNPIEYKSDYRIQVLSQSLQITYDSPTINKLVTCFEPDTARNLYGVKQAAYSTYTDVKQRSYLLMKHNLEKVKVLDINIDMQSSYFLLPANGVYQDGCSLICMDFGHLTLKRADEDQEISHENAKNLEEARKLSYTKFQLQLDSVQLLYAQKNEKWYEARRQQETRLHLIKPMTLNMNVYKCIYSDDADLPAWKIDGQIPAIDMRLSDKRLFQIIHHVQSLPFPETKNTSETIQKIEPAEQPSQISLSAADTMEKVEEMTPVKKIQEEQSQLDENEQSKIDEKKRKKENSYFQLTQLDATFELSQVNLLIEESSSQSSSRRYSGVKNDHYDEGSDERPFLRLSLVSMLARTTFKTYDVSFDASLADIILLHQQFVTQSGEPLRLISAKKHNENDDTKLISVHFLNTSRDNPMFKREPYNSIENAGKFHFSKLEVILQLEALLSILRFHDNLIKRLPTETEDEKQKKREQEEEKKKNEQQENDKVITTVTDKEKKKPDTVVATPSLAISAELEEFRFIISTEEAPLFDISVGGLKANVSQQPNKTIVNLILSNFNIYDPNPHAKYKKIISQQGDADELLRIDLILHNLSNDQKKDLNAVDCNVEVKFAKANIVFLFKHIDVLLSFLDTLDVAKAALELASSQYAEATIENIQKLQEQAFKLQLDVQFNAPNIFVPTNSYSNEALLLDLGKLSLRTKFLQDEKHGLIEQQNIKLENVLASRVLLNNNHDIEGEVILLDCEILTTTINRLLYPDQAKNEPVVSVKADWDLVHFKLSKGDFSCIMKVLLENFSENIKDQIVSDIETVEQYHYKSADQEAEENKLRETVLQKQHESHTEVTTTVRVRAEIKTVALTLYLGESNMTKRRQDRLENLKLADVRIEALETIFKQMNDSSYKAVGRIKNFLLDDLRETHQSAGVTRMMDKHFSVDPSNHVLIASFEFKPKNKQRDIALRQFNAQLESLYICISLDYLMTLQDFFLSGLPIGSNVADKDKYLHVTKEDKQTSKAITNIYPSDQSLGVSRSPSTIDRQKSRNSVQFSLPKTPSKNEKSAASRSHGVEVDIETRVEVFVKNPEIILLEDQHKADSNCLVLDMAAQMKMFNTGDDTKMYVWVKDLTVYSSNLAKLKIANDNLSKIRYRILQPAKVDLIMISDSYQQKIDVRVSDIIVSIAPAAVRTVINVINSIGALQVSTTKEMEKVNAVSLFDPKPFKDSSFWFIGPEHNTMDILQAVTGDSSEQKEVIEQEKKIKEIEEKLESQPTVMVQQLILVCDTIEVKLEVGFGSSTKSVIAMCLSNLTADLKNWSSVMLLSSTVSVEMALFNERMLTWEPLIEPYLESKSATLVPWSIACSIVPGEREDYIEDSSEVSNDQNDSTAIQTNEQKSDINQPLPSSAKQIIIVRADQLLSLTLTKTGLDLLEHLSALFNDVYNQRLPLCEDEPLLSIYNATGVEVYLDNLDGLEFAEIKKKSYALKNNESVALTVPHDRLSMARLSVIEEQNHHRRQELSIKIGNDVKTVSLTHTWQQVYDIGLSPNSQWPVQMLCDVQLNNDRRRIVFSSIVKIYNSTSVPLSILHAEAGEIKNAKRVTKIDVNQEYYMPMWLLYVHSHSPIFFAIDEGGDNEPVNDFFSFDWTAESTTNRKLKLKNGSEAHFVIYKEVHNAYSENTDQNDKESFSIYVHPALHLTNLLPLDVQCTINNNETINMKPSDLQMVTSGDKNSVLIFTILNYSKLKWISEPINLQEEQKNEDIIKFHDQSGNTLNMALRVETFHKSYRILLYAPYWILNRTSFDLDFQIENQQTDIPNVETPFLICPEKIDTNSNKKAQIRVRTAQLDHADTNWCEKFSLDVIKSTGVAICKIPDNKTYMLCVEIVTSSFGMSKIITLSPSMIIINNSTIELEVIETVDDKEQDKWGPLNPGGVVPFWPHSMEKGLMRVRYTERNHVLSQPFIMNQKHRTLLRMEDKDRPAINVEVTATDFNGVRLIFSDYKIGDAPIMIVNCLKNDSITFHQTEEESKSQVLPPLNYVYYTWVDPMKPRSLISSVQGNTTSLDLTPQCGFIGEHHQINYTSFIDGVQTVLLFADNTNIIEQASGVLTLAESMGQRIQIGIHDIGISIVDDIKHEELLYISMNKSKVVWTEQRKSRWRPFNSDLNHALEETYKVHQDKKITNPDDLELRKQKYSIMENRQVIFIDDNTGDLINQRGRTIKVRRQALDGLWIDYAWSVTKAALHVRINRVQIDNQLDYTIFPVILYPITSKITETDTAEKPFIELSIYETKGVRSNIMQFKYFKLLIQEFAVCVDQGLIVSILSFIKSEKPVTAPVINMDTDLELINKPLSTIIKEQTNSPSGEKEMYFDQIHLSPLKIHVSFSMHGANPSEELLAEYPFARFLLKTLNVAEVQDVILRLGYYERKQDRQTFSRLTSEVGSHYQNQFMKQIHVLVLGLDVLGNPFGVIRGLAQGVESLFYEPYKGAVEGPFEFAEGVVTGVKTLFGSAVGGAAGAFSKITGVLGKGLATLTFDEEYKQNRIRRKEPTNNTQDIAVGGKNIVMGFLDGVTGVVKKPVEGAKQGGASGFVKGLGKGFIGLVTRPTGGIVDFASTSLDMIKRAATNEELVRRVRYPRHIGKDGLVRPYIAHEAMGFYILNRLDSGKYSKTDTYIAHINCCEAPPGWLMATSKRILFITEISFLGQYQIDWQFEYSDLKDEPIIKPNLQQIQILIKEAKNMGTIRTYKTYGKMVKYRSVTEAKYIVAKIIEAMHTVGL